MTRHSQFSIGIDLGTTNCVAAYLDLSSTAPQPRVFPIPQLVGPGEVAPRPTLPSFLYFPLQGEVEAGDLAPPFPVAWKGKLAPASVLIGAYARERGVANPQRLVSSAKSWLCHAQVDRRAPILPWAAPHGIPRISPVEASALLLAYIRAAWNHAFAQDQPAARMEHQELFITLPASFDADARRLTEEAVEMAGLGGAGLLEEPQAAFYSWLAEHAADWHATVTPGQTVLVFDMGGGTTDLTLIKAVEDDHQPLGLRRIAVGQHLLLGGDNFDAALAREIEDEWTGGRQLPPEDWLGLIFRVRDAKERILESAEPPEGEIPITLPGRGSRIVGGTRTAQISPIAWKQRLLDGFFPDTALSATLKTGSEAGLGEFGLPYAQDPAVTRHLAHFLQTHLKSEQGSWEDWPDWVLFNGGVFRSSALRNGVLEVLHHWSTQLNEPQQIQELVHPLPDLAVALGAAQYGLARVGRAVQVSAALPRSYYIGLGNTDSDVGALLCIAPRGMETGAVAVCDQHPLQLQVGTPVQFPLFSSTSRPQDSAGELVMLDADRMLALPPLAARLQSGKRTRPRRVPVFLRAEKGELGHLLLQCVQTDEQRAWTLEVQHRLSAVAYPAPPSDTADPAADHEGQTTVQQTFREILEQDLLNDIGALIDRTFEAEDPKTAAALNSALEQVSGLPREDWPLTLLRWMVDRLLPLRAQAGRSAEHESAWLNLVGYALRPGLGDPADAWRINRLWGQRHDPLCFPEDRRVLAQSWILWRRIAPGMTLAAQEELAAKAVQRLHQKGTAAKGRRKKSGYPPLGRHEEDEILRLLASLERLLPDRKREIGDWALKMLKIEGRRRTALWCLARLAARQPFAPALEAVLPTETAELYLEDVLRLPAPLPPEAIWAIGRIAHLTGDRYRDLRPDARERAIERLSEMAEAGDTLAVTCRGWLQAPCILGAADQEQMLGEHLPTGLSLG